MKLLVFDEIKNVPYLWAFFGHFRAQKMGQNCDYFQKSGNFAHKVFLRLTIPWK